MSTLENYLERLEDENPEVAASVEKTVNQSDNMWLDRFDGTGHTKALLFGEVQSGKTGQIFGLACAAEEHGIPAFVLLTTDNTKLQEQTYRRTVRELGMDFAVCGESDEIMFEEIRLRRPTVVVVKKNARLLQKWRNILMNTDFMKGNPLMIIDDEGDAASLNTNTNNKKKAKQSMINKTLVEIRDGSMSGVYLSVTGTPQALLLQTLRSDMRPDFVQYFKPGKGYLGGEFFFPDPSKRKDEDKTRPVIHIDKIDNPVRDAIIHHLCVSAQFLPEKKVSNALFHPGIKTVSHENMRAEILQELDWCRTHPEELKRLAEELWENTNPRRNVKKPFDEIWKGIQNLLEDERISVFIINSKSESEVRSFDSGCNIVIGGNSLGRGVTIPVLHTVYYTRRSKNPQADTMWQHNRMFGYDRDEGLIRVWMTKELDKLFSDIQAQNSSIISQIKKGWDQVSIISAEGLSPTRKNVLDTDKLDVIVGGTNMYPLSPRNRTITEIDRLLEPFSDGKQEYQVSIGLIRTILSHIEASSDFDMESIRAFLDSIAGKDPNDQAYLIVRRDRRITQGTGALLSPNDWNLSNSHPNSVVLTLYKMSRDAKGWKQKGLWVPNIRFPDDLVIYRVHKEPAKS